MFGKREYRLIKDEFNDVYNVVLLGEHNKVCLPCIDKNPNKVMQKFVNWRLDEGEMGESILTHLLDMVVYCDDFEGRRAIREQIDNYLYYQNIDEGDML